MGTGPSMFGPATNKTARYHGIANCYIKGINGQWQYTNAWDLPDMWSFLVQLGVDISAQEHPKTDLMTVDECKPLFEWGSGKMNWFPSLPSEASRGVAAKVVVDSLEHARNQMHPSNSEPHVVV